MLCQNPAHSMTCWFTLSSVHSRPSVMTSTRAFWTRVLTESISPAPVCSALREVEQVVLHPSVSVDRELDPTAAPVERVAGQSHHVEGIHHRSRVREFLDGGGLEPGEPVHRDHLDTVAPRRLTASRVMRAPAPTARSPFHTQHSRRSDSSRQTDSAVGCMISAGSPPSSRRARPSAPQAPPERSGLFWQGP